MVPVSVGVLMLLLPIVAGAPVGVMPLMVAMVAAAPGSGTAVGSMLTRRAGLLTLTLPARSNTRAW